MHLFCRGAQGQISGQTSHALYNPARGYAAIVLVNALVPLADLENRGARIGLSDCAQLLQEISQPPSARLQAIPTAQDDLGVAAHQRQPP